MTDLVRAASSWNGMLDVGAFSTAEELIAHGEKTKAWPTALRKESMRTSSGLSVPGSMAVVGTFGEKEKTLGVVGNVFRETDPDEWRTYVRAAVAAGAKPTGALAHKGRVCATFDLGGNGIRNVFILADSFDSSLKLTAGCIAFRPPCANMLSAIMRADKKRGAEKSEMIGLRHTASMEHKVKWLEAAIQASIKTGTRISTVYNQATGSYLPPRLAAAVFNTLFPEAAKDAPEAAKTKAETKRNAARAAGRMAINRVGDRPGNLGTLWNAATYLVDRKEDGSSREVRGEEGTSAMFDSLMFGNRAARIREIQELIEVVMVDGKVELMEVTKALEAGVEAQLLGKKIVADLMNGES